MFDFYDVIVVGAGHAGCEAAAAAANLGSKVLLITANLQTIGQMSCNPAMGGIAKGQIVREIDALGGYSGIVTDRSMIQFRMLNRSKGVAMWSPRAQNDRMSFAGKWRQMLEKTTNIDFYQDTVQSLIIKKGTAEGVVTMQGHQILSNSVILTNGTFLNGIIHIGERHFAGGRISETSVSGLSEQLVNTGFESARLKTGTPPRIDGRSLNYQSMEVQNGDEEISGFSFLPTSKINPRNQKNCWITYTNPDVHDILKLGFDKSPMYQGRISGVGPRYCPSIEDKINRFSDRDRHQLFIEPEGWNTVEIYVNGFSTSLPEEIQLRALRRIEGFEKCKMFRPGYAIEYDYFPPTQLTATLETKLISNLFFAGQINGTTGYEEAAGQGIIAGINAHLKSVDNQQFILKRSDAYIGVLIDDLINKGTDEPYRMFTSRAEFRTLLRQDNADVRLTPLSHAIGLASQDRMARVSVKIDQANQIETVLSEIILDPEDVNPYLEHISSPLISSRQKASQLILRPSVSLTDMLSYISKIGDKLKKFEPNALEQAEISLKYGNYIEKERALVEKMSLLEDLQIPEHFNYSKIPSLSTEARQKFLKIKPRTLGQAGRISGVNPSDIQILMVYMGR